MQGRPSKWQDYPEQTLAHIMNEWILQFPPDSVSPAHPAARSRAAALSDHYKLCVPTGSLTWTAHSAGPAGRRAEEAAPTQHALLPHPHPHLTHRLAVLVETTGLRVLPVSEEWSTGTVPTLSGPGMEISVEGMLPSAAAASRRRYRYTIGRVFTNTLVLDAPTQTAHVIVAVYRAEEEDPEEVARREEEAEEEAGQDFILWQEIQAKAAAAEVRPQKSNAFALSQMWRDRQEMRDSTRRLRQQQRERARPPVEPAPLLSLLSITTTSAGDGESHHESARPLRATLTALFHSEAGAGADADATLPTLPAVPLTLTWHGRSATLFGVLPQRPGQVRNLGCPPALRAAPGYTRQHTEAIAIAPRGAADPGIQPPIEPPSLRLVQPGVVPAPPCITDMVWSGARDTVLMAVISVGCQIYYFDSAARRPQWMPLGLPESISSCGDFETAANFTGPRLLAGCPTTTDHAVAVIDGGTVTQSPEKVRFILPGSATVRNYSHSLLQGRVLWELPFFATSLTVHPHTGTLYVTGAEGAFAVLHPWTAAFEVMLELEEHLPLDVGALVAAYLRPAGELTFHKNHWATHLERIRYRRRFEAQVHDLLRRQNASLFDTALFQPHEAGIVTLDMVDEPTLEESLRLPTTVDSSRLPAHLRLPALPHRKPGRRSAFSLPPAPSSYSAFAPSTFTS